MDSSKVVRALDINDSELNPIELRESLQRRGPTFVKIGQFLALRPDILPQEYCDELLKLSDEVPPFRADQAKALVEEALGVPLAERFSRFNPHPIAAASFAQVHGARTLDGEEVAIKVQRPGAREMVQRDLKEVGSLARVLGVLGATQVVSLPEILAEFSRWMNEELDTAHELENLVRMYELSADSRIMRVPRPYPELSGRGVLTAELLRGVPFSELLQLVRVGKAERIAELGFDRAILTENLVASIFTQIFRYEFFHADTHPGNLIALPGNVVGFVDLALVDTLSVSFRQGMTRYLSAVYSNDVDRMVHGLLEVFLRTDASNVEGFRHDFKEEAERWTASRRREADTGGASIQQYMIGVVGAARRNGLRIPPRILSMYRSLLTAGSVANQMGGGANLASVGRRFFTRLQVDRTLDDLRLEKLAPTALDALALLKEGPGQLQRILADLANDRFVLPMKTFQSADDKHQANVRAQLVAGATVSVAVAILLVSIDQLVPVKPFRLSWLLWIVLAALYVWLVRLWNKLL